MAKYVFLINWTAQGIADAQDTTERANHAEQVAKKLGGSNFNFIWTIGRYDIVLTCDLPDDEAATLFALQVGRQGAVRTETLRGFTADEMDAMLAKLG